MKFLFSISLIFIVSICFSQNQSIETKYFTRDSSVVVQSIVTQQSGKVDTSEQVTSSKAVTSMIEQKSAQRAQLRQAYEQSENEFKMLMEIFFEVRKEEDKAKSKDFKDKKSKK
jgi:uncharacterized protein YrzB (UPF0473 family)